MACVPGVMTKMPTIVIFTVLLFIPELYANEDFVAERQQKQGIQLPQLDEPAGRNQTRATPAPLTFSIPVLIENSRRQRIGLPPMSTSESLEFLEKKKRDDEQRKKSMEIVIAIIRQIEGNARREEAARAEQNRRLAALKNTSHYLSIDAFVQNGQVAEAAKYFVSNDCLQETLAVLKHYQDTARVLPSAVKNESMPVLLVLMGGALLENRTEAALQTFEGAIRSYENPATVFAIGTLLDKAGTVRKLYSLLESSAGGFISLGFREIRWALMRAFLWSTGWTVSEYEKSMASNIIKKDSDGFTDFKDTKLNLTGEVYHSVDGISLELTNGSFELKTSHAGELPGLVTRGDVFEVLSKGIQDSIFSLDPSFPEMKYHPFQRMRFSPSQMEGTEYLATLFQADYLLKGIALGVESSNKRPFAFKDINPDLKALLPEHIFQELEYKPLEGLTQNKTLGYRFWIEAGEIPIVVEKTETRISFRFGYISMYIRRKQQVRDPLTGELSDVEEDDAPTETDECDDRFCKFALAFTKYYDEIAYHLPIFARLRELLKISAISSSLTRSNLLKEGLTEHQVTLFQNRFKEEGYAPETETGDSIMVTSDYWVPTSFRWELGMNEVNDTHVGLQRVLSYGGVHMQIQMVTSRHDLFLLEQRWRLETSLRESKTLSLQRAFDAKRWELEREEFRKQQEEQWRRFRAENADANLSRQVLEREKLRQEAEVEKTRQAEKSRKLKEEREAERKLREAERESEWRNSFGNKEVRPGVTLAGFRGLKNLIPKRGSTRQSSPKPTTAPSSKLPTSAPKSPSRTPETFEAIKKSKLPEKGQVPFEPPTDKSGKEVLKRVKKGGRSQETGFEDKYGNKWFKGPSRTKGEPFEWDVELSEQGRRKHGGNLKPGKKHLNVSLDGKITH